MIRPAGAATRLFGSWLLALDAAGISAPSTSARIEHHSLEGNQLMSREDVFREIVAREANKEILTEEGNSSRTPYIA